MAKRNKSVNEIKPADPVDEPLYLSFKKDVERDRERKVMQERGEKELDVIENMQGVIDEMRKRLDNMQSGIQKSQDAVSRKTLMSIVDNINISIKFINEIDKTAQEIISKEDELRIIILKLENQNRLDEANNLKDMALLKFYKFFERVITEHSLLRNEFMQLQKKVMDSQ